MYRKLKVPILGIIENMSSYVCNNCNHESNIFGKGGGEIIAAEIDVPFLGQIPIYEPIRVGSDSGLPIVLMESDSSAARAFMQVSERAAAQISIASYESIESAKPV